jgi:hypothetical protein
MDGFSRAARREGWSAALEKGQEGALSLEKCSTWESIGKVTDRKCGESVTGLSERAVSAADA